MASTFLTRLRLGPMLVDAKGVSRLYEGRVRRLDILLLVGAALVAMLVVGIVAEPIHVFAARPLGHAQGHLRAADDQLPVPHRVADRDLPRPRARHRDRRGRHRPRRSSTRSTTASTTSRRSPTASSARTTSSMRGRTASRRRSRRCSRSRSSGASPATRSAFVAVRGVDDDRVHGLVTAAQQADATVTGMLWIEAKWALARRRRRRRSQAALGNADQEQDDAAHRGMAQLASGCWRRPPRVTRRRTTCSPRCSTAGFVQYDEVDGGSTHRRLPGRGARCSCSWSASEADVPSENVVLPAATALSQAADVPLVVADVWVELDRRPGARRRVQPIRDSEPRPHDLDRRRPRPRRGPDHGDAGAVRPLPASRRWSATTATGPTPHRSPTSRRVPRPRHVGHRAVKRRGRRARRPVVSPRRRRAGRRGRGATAPRGRRRRRAGSTACSSSRSRHVEWSRPRAGRHAQPRPPVRGVGRRRDGHQRRRSPDPAGERLRDASGASARATADG